MARTVAEIEADIAKTKEELANVHGTEAEVYARIVGYYRSVRNWNKGKREEYKERKVFAPTQAATDAAIECDCGNATAPGAFSGEKESALARLELFTRKTCPNCPPVKEYVEGHFEDVSIIDVDSEEGFNRAQECGVLSTPTVIFYDETCAEIARAHSLGEVKAVNSLQLTASSLQRIG